MTFLPNSTVWLKSTWHMNGQTHSDSQTLIYGQIRPQQRLSKTTYTEKAITLNPELFKANSLCAQYTAWALGAIYTVGFQKDRQLERKKIHSWWALMSNFFFIIKDRIWPVEWCLQHPREADFERISKSSLEIWGFWGAKKDNFSFCSDWSFWSYKQLPEGLMDSCNGFLVFARSSGW